MPLIGLHLDLLWFCFLRKNIQLALCCLSGDMDIYCSAFPLWVYLKDCLLWQWNVIDVSCKVHYLLFWPCLFTTWNFGNYIKKVGKHQVFFPAGINNHIWSCSQGLIKMAFQGSTCTFSEAILRHCGFCIGLFTSPHLIDVRERFHINGLVYVNDFFFNDMNLHVNAFSFVIN